MKTELLKRLTDSIESHKNLLHTFRTILLEDRLDGTSLFCHFNYKIIHEMNNELERILNEYLLLNSPTNKNKSLSI